MEITSTTAQTAAQTATDTSKSATSPSDKLANENTFLQLLSAQIRNQDPLQPTDGVQFLSQLAQFSQLEQLIGIRSDLQGIGADTPAATTNQDAAASAASA